MNKNSKIETTTTSSVSGGSDFVGAVSPRFGFGGFEKPLQPKFYKRYGVRKKRNSKSRRESVKEIVDRLLEM
jgi:hypothetical protein